MPATSTITPLPTTSSYPKGAPHAVEISTVVRALSHKISDERHGGTLAGSVESFFKKHQLEADETLLPILIQEIGKSIAADNCYDSEAKQAYRASITAFLKHMPCTPSKGYPVYQTIKLTGWLGGQSIIVNGVCYELTGRACPQCTVNPEAYGAAWSGVRCVDELTCGWSYCA